MDTLEFITRYLILPLSTVVCSMGWYMIKKQNDRIDAVEIRTNDTEKNVIEIRTEIRKDIQYMAEDIKDIKELLKSRSS